MTKLKAILYIRSYDDLLQIHNVNEIIPLRPTTIWQKGDVKTRTDNKVRYYISSNWDYEMPEIWGTDINISLLPLIDIIKPYKANFKQIKILGFEIYITLILNIIDHNRPIMTLNKYVIDSLSELNCELSFDMYFDEPDE